VPERPAGARPGARRDRVLQLVTSTDRRGAEVAATQLGDALGRQGIAVDTVALWPGTGSARLDLETLGRRRRDPSTLVALTRRASVVVGQGSSTLPFGAMGSVAARTPFVYRSIGDPAFWATTAARRARVRLAIQRARIVVAIWPGAADALTRLYGVAAGRLEVIPNGVPADAFTPTPIDERPARRRALAASLGVGIDPDRPMVTYLGALSPEKDPLLAVATMDRLPHVQLVVAGTGPLAAEVRVRSREGGDVHVIGAVDDAAALLAASDALVVPSRTEGIPAVAIEAGMAGLPVVACTVGGLAEVVEDGRTGRLVGDRRPESMAAALAEVLDPSTGEAMGQAARERCVARFALDAVAARWATLLGQVGGTVR